MSAQCNICTKPMDSLKPRYGSQSCCLSCRTFFRRSVLNGMFRLCKQNGNCKIYPQDRVNCGPCRYNKCLSVGMQPSNVRIENGRDLSRRDRNEDQDVDDPNSADDDYVDIIFIKQEPGTSSATNTSRSLSTITWNNPCVATSPVKQEPMDTDANSKKPGTIKQERTSFDSDFYTERNRHNETTSFTIKQEPKSYCDTHAIKHEVEILDIRIEPIQEVRKAEPVFITWNEPPVIEIKEEPQDDMNSSTQFNFSNFNQGWNNTCNPFNIKTEIKSEPGTSAIARVSVIQLNPALKSRRF